MPKKQIVKIAKGRCPKGCTEETFSAEDLEGGGGKCPDGTFGFEIKKVELKEGDESGEPYYNFTWKGISGAASGKLVYDTLSMQASVAWRRRLYLEAMGYELEAGKQYHIAWEELVGEQAVLEIECAADSKYPNVKEIHSIELLNDLAVEPAVPMAANYDEDVPDDFGSTSQVADDPGEEEEENEPPPIAAKTAKANSKTNGKKKATKVAKKSATNVIDIGQRVEFDTNDQEDGEDVIVTVTGTVTSMDPFTIIDDLSNDYEGWSPEEVRVI